MSRMGFPPLSMESIPFSQLAAFLHMGTQDSNLEKTALTAVRTRSYHLQLSFGATKADTKHAGTRSFHLRWHRIWVRSIGRGLAVGVNAAVSGEEIIRSHDGAILANLLF